MAGKYLNVTRAEWSAMCQRSYELQQLARTFRSAGDAANEQRVWLQIRPLHEHMKAISHLTPTDGHPPRDYDLEKRKLCERIRRYRLPSQRAALNQAKRRLAELEALSANP